MSGSLGRPAEKYHNAYMARGHEQEEEARALYEVVTSATVDRVGFIKNEEAGYSPDGLIDEDGLLEVKTMAGHILIEHAEADRVPPEHLPQIQGGLWVSGRAWLDFIGYCPGHELLQYRVARDDEYIEETLAPAVKAFNQELRELVARRGGAA